MIFSRLCYNQLAVAQLELRKRQINTEYLEAEHLPKRIEDNDNVDVNKPNLKLKNWFLKSKSGGENWDV